MPLNWGTIDYGLFFIPIGSIEPQLQLVWRNYVSTVLEIPEHNNVLRTIGVCYDKGKAKSQTKQVFCNFS